MKTQLVVLDMAGTTVIDDGAVEAAFQAALDGAALPIDRDVALQYVRDTMGESKISVFRHLAGDEDGAQRLNVAFEQAYAGLVDGGRCAPIDGAADTIAALRDGGAKVALTTGFSRATADRILDALG